MNTTTALSSKLYFSYSQFMVYDQSERLPGCDWTDEHSAQGFARRESTVCFGTPLEFGHAEVTVITVPFESRRDYERVIAVPFFCSSGKITIEGPEEMDVERSFELPRGNYRLIAAQMVVSDEEELIDLFFESVPEPLKQSAVLVADESLNPPRRLLETAGVAGA